MIQRKLLALLLLVFIIGCTRDYTKKLGKDYILEKTNTCCIFILKKNVKPAKEGNIIFYDTRVIKPKIKELYINNSYIVGLKVSNKCCYLTEYEKRHNTPNGYFIINKNSEKIISGLKKVELKKYKIQLGKMIKVL